MLFSAACCAKLASWSSAFGRGLAAVGRWARSLGARVVEGPKMSARVLGRNDCRLLGGYWISGLHFLWFDRFGLEGGGRAFGRA